MFARNSAQRNSQARVVFTLENAPERGVSMSVRGKANRELSMADEMEQGGHSAEYLASEMMTQSTAIERPRKSLFDLVRRRSSTKLDREFVERIGNLDQQIAKSEHAATMFRKQVEHFAKKAEACSLKQDKQGCISAIRDKRRAEANLRSHEESKNHLSEDRAKLHNAQNQRQTLSQHAQTAQFLQKNIDADRLEKDLRMYDKAMQDYQDMVDDLDSIYDSGTSVEDDYQKLCAKVALTQHAQQSEALLAEPSSQWSVASDEPIPEDS